ncbi:MAG: YncE family protein [Clostridium sp.]|nr:YncE family protein [Clostridium sp.]
MDSIIVCNTASDSLSMISLENDSVYNIPLSSNNILRGPHGIEVYKNKILTANNYDSSISVIDLDKKKEIENYFIGAHPNDIKTYKNKGYILCGEINSLVVFDMQEKSTIFQMNTDENPHSNIIDNNGIGYLCSLQGNSLEILDCSKDIIIKKILGFNYPIKVIISKNLENLFVVESCLGEEKEGYINILSKKDFSSLLKIKVGKSPVDIWEDDDKLYVSNFEDGTISIINLNLGKEVKKIYVGGMPRGIIKYKKNIFVGDYYNQRILKIDLENKKTKTIAVGKEPNAMILLQSLQQIIN